MVGSWGFLFSASLSLGCGASPGLRVKDSAVGLRVKDSSDLMSLRIQRSRVEGRGSRVEGWGLRAQGLRVYGRG
jgi:hypothetical protein